MSNVISDLKKVLLVPIHKEGNKFIAIFAATAFILALFSSTLGLIGLILTAWCVYFFRNPPRHTIANDNEIISPADGVVNSIEQNATPPSELELDKHKKWTKISVFLNVFDVHVNRVPTSGKVTKIKYQEGQFLSANANDASEKNERSSVVLKTKNNQEIVFSQVAGLVARRIINDLKEGDNVKAGDLYGIIRFGSRTDLYLPSNTEIKTLVGQKMIGGETIIAKLAGKVASAATKKFIIKAYPRKGTTNKATVKTSVTKTITKKK
jgi:phosphatidylserine decarboxylase